MMQHPIHMSKKKKKNHAFTFKSMNNELTVGFNRSVDLFFFLNGEKWVYKKELLQLQFA